MESRLKVQTFPEASVLNISELPSMLVMISSPICYYFSGRTQTLLKLYPQTPSALLLNKHIYVFLCKCNL